MPQPKIKEEERIERIIRGLIKLPENKRCINCNSLGPQYVCTTFWTFVCTNCSGVHREFTHRVKSVSMAKFSADEVAALQAGGNEQARKNYFKTWDPQRNYFPNSSNLHRLRDFIRHVYVDGKYSGERNNDKVALNKAVAKDDYFEQRSSESSSRVARDNFFERRTGRSDQALRNDFHDRRSFEGFSPRNSERTLKYYIEERSRPGYRQHKLKSASRRSQTAHFEIVDDRFREDGVRTGRRFESNRYLDADSRALSSSPVSQKGRNKTCPPPVHPVKDILGNNIPPPKLGEPPKANDKKNIECSTQAQKAAGPTNPGSTDKGETNNTVNICDLIDFAANPEPPANAAAMQTQQNVPSSDGGNISAPTSKNEKPSNTSNVNSMEFLLFELTGPTVAPSGGISEHSPGGDTTSAATEGSLNNEAARTPGSTTHYSLNSIHVGTINASPVQNAPTFPHVSSHSVVSISQAQQLPAVNQNQSFAVPPGNDSPTSLQTSLSVQSLNNQCFSSEPAHIKGPLTHVPSKQSPQDVSNLAQDTSTGNESVFRGRKELPADIFTASRSSFQAAVPGWQFHTPYGMGYGMQYHTPAMGSQDSVKSKNPFDLGDGGLQFQAAAFPSMSSLQGALQNISASPGPWPQGLPFASVDNSQGMSYRMMIPPDACMGQQFPNNTMPSKNNGGDDVDAFASLNQVQHSSGSNPASAESNSYLRENPFG